MKLPYSIANKALLLSFIFFCKISYSQSVIFSHAGSINGDGNETCKIATDSKGSVYISGVYTGNSLNFGNAVSINKNGFSNIYLAKYDTIGNLIWVKNFGGTNASATCSIDIDRVGDIILWGNFTGSMQLGANQLMTTGQPDGFIAKIDDIAGDVVWAKQIGGDSTEIINDIDIDNENNILLCGQFTGKDYTLGTQILNAVTTGKGNLFYAKLDDTGNSIWAKAAIKFSGEGKCVKIASGPNNTIILLASSRVYENPNNLRFFNEYLQETTGINQYKGDRVYLIQTDKDGNGVTHIYTDCGKGAQAYDLVVRDKIYLRQLCISGLSYTQYDNNILVADTALPVSPASFYMPSLNSQNSYSFTNYIFNSFGGGNLSQYRRDVNDMAIDNNGDIFLPGATSNTIDLDSTFALFHLYNNSSLIDTIRLNAQSNPVVSSGISIAIDTSTNHIFIAGNYRTLGQFIIGNNTLPASDQNSFDLFFMKAEISATVPVTPLKVQVGNDTSICNGRGVQLNAKAEGGSNSYTFSWLPETGISSTNIPNPFVVPTSTTSYIVTVQDSYGNIAKDTVKITVMPSPPTPTISATGLTLCGGNSITLTSSAISGNYWAGPGGGSTQSIDISFPGTYSVKTFDGNGCESPYSTPVIITTVLPPPALVISANGPTTFCEGNSVILSSSAPNNNLWSTGATTQSITVNSSGNYSVKTITNNGCELASLVSITVTKNPLPAIPVITANGATKLCNGNSVELISPVANNYLWSNGATTQSIIVSEANDYTVSVTNIEGCSATSIPVTISVSNIDPPVITQTGNTLTSTSANSYQWYKEGDLLPGETNQSLDITAGTNYSVSISNSDGCTASSEPFTAKLFRPTNVNNETFYHQEYPNPVTNNLNISYTLASTQTIGIIITNSNGTRVMLVQNKKEQAAGTYNLSIKDIAGRLGKGIYFVKYNVNGKDIVQQILIQ